MKVGLAILAGLGVVAIVAMAAVTILAGGSKVHVTSVAVSQGQEESLVVRTGEATLICPIEGCCSDRGGVIGVDTGSQAALCRDGSTDDSCPCQAKD